MKMTRFALTNLIVGLFSVVAQAQISPIDNPGGFSEYYCGKLSPLRFISAPASLSGDKAAWHECANRIALSEATLQYGTDVKLVSVKQGISGHASPDVIFVAVVRLPNGKQEHLKLPLQVDNSKNASDGSQALVIQLDTDAL